MFFDLIHLAHHFALLLPGPEWLKRLKKIGIMVAVVLLRMIVSKSIPRSTAYRTKAIAVSSKGMMAGRALNWLMMDLQLSATRQDQP